jgi:hypothetical protein
MTRKYARALQQDNTKYNFREEQIYRKNIFNGVKENQEPHEKYDELDQPLYASPPC